MAGQHAGLQLAQQTPCDVWGYSGGIEYHDLTAGLPMKVRVTAPAYARKDTTITPVDGPVSAIIIAPLPLH